MTSLGYTAQIRRVVNKMLITIQLCGNIYSQPKAETKAPPFVIIFMLLYLDLLIGTATYLGGVTTSTSNTTGAGSVSQSLDRFARMQISSAFITLFGRSKKYTTPKAEFPIANLRRSKHTTWFCSEASNAMKSSMNCRLQPHNRASVDD